MAETANADSAADAVLVNCSMPDDVGAKGAAAALAVLANTSSPEAARALLASAQEADPAKVSSPVAVLVNTEQAALAEPVMIVPTAPVAAQAKGLIAALAVHANTSLPVAAHAFDAMVAEAVLANSSTPDAVTANEDMADVPDPVIAEPAGPNAAAKMDHQSSTGFIATAVEVPCAPPSTMIHVSVSACSCADTINAAASPPIASGCKYKLFEAPHAMMVSPDNVDAMVAAAAAGVPPNCVLVAVSRTAPNGGYSTMAMSKESDEDQATLTVTCSSNVA